MKNRLIAAHGVLYKEKRRMIDIDPHDIPFIVFIVIVIAIAVAGFWG